MRILTLAVLIFLSMASGAQEIGLKNRFSLSSDSGYKWSLNLFNFNFYSASRSGALKWKDFLSMNEMNLKADLTGFKNPVDFLADGKLSGPSIELNAGKAGSFFFGMEYRLTVAGSRVDGRLVSEIDDHGQAKVAHPYAMQNESMNMSTTAFSKTSLGWSHSVFHSGKHYLNAGIRLNYLSGIANTSLEVQNLSGTVKYDSNMNDGYLTGTTGMARTLTSGTLFTNFSLANLFNFRKGSLGLDAGLVYQYRPVANGPYRWRASLAVKDLGSLRFQADSFLSKAYSIHIAANKSFYFRSNFSGKDFSSASKIFDASPGFFTRTGVDASIYSIALPSFLHATIDYNIGHGFFINAELQQRLKKNTINSIYGYSHYRLTPRWEWKRNSIFLFSDYSELSGMQAGIALKWGPFLLGSESLFTSFATGKQVDGFVALNFFWGSKSIPKKVESKYRILAKLDDDSTFKNQWTASLRSEAVIAGNHVPFWMRSRQYGGIPLNNASISVTATAERDYRRDKYFLIDWGGRLQLRTNLGNKVEAIIQEAFLKFKLWHFELRAGRDKETIGLTGDTILTPGSFSISGNALGIPKLQVSVPEYSYILGGKLFAFKGNFAYGWMGRGAVNDSINIYNGQIYFHQKSLYGRIGKPSWRVQFYGGFNHQAMWGWDKQAYGNRYDLSDLRAFSYIMLGKVYKGSKLGNHLGSIDLGMSYRWKGVELMGYHQFFYDVGALYHLANLRDGLTGVCITNKLMNTRRVQWKKILFEFFHTKNQAGELWSKPTPSGDENYYNNWGRGWTYKALGLGNPFITPAYTTKQGLPNDPSDFFNNNRILAFYTGIEGSIKQWQLITKLSYSKNYGTFGTSAAGHSLGTRHYPPTHGLFGKLNQFSAYFEANRELKNGLRIGGIAAFDIGQLFYNSGGFGITVSKRFQ